MFPEALEPDDSGGCFVLTQSFHSCPNWQLGDPPCPIDLKVHHLLADGSQDPAWPPGGFLLTDHAGWDFHGWVVSDRFGGAYAAWYDTTSDTLRIRAQHLGPNGQPYAGWAADGKELAAATGSQIRYVLDLDATSTGALVATLELNWEPYLVALAPDGTTLPGWPAEKRLIPPLTFPDDMFSSNYNTALTPQDWIVVVWETFTSYTGVNIWGTAVDSDGRTLPGWPTAVRAICTAPGAQARPYLALDADGQTFKVVWEDTRLGPNIGEAIYYDRFWLTDGTVPTAWSVRLLGARFDGRALRASWRVSGGDLDSVVALRSVDGGTFGTISRPLRAGAEELALQDSLPPSFASARYVLAASESSALRAISDTLEIRARSETGRLRLRCAAIQRGAALSFQVDLDRDMEEGRVEVFDVTGRRVLERRLGMLAAGSHPVVLDLGSEPSGLYYVRVSGPGGSRATSGVARIR